MTRVRSWAALCLAAVLAACGGGDPDVPGSGSPAGAPTTPGSFSAVVSFGDSLSDLGTYTQATSLNVPVDGLPPYQGGKFTTNSATATLWVENVAAALSVPITPHQWGFGPIPVTTCPAFVFQQAPRSSCTGHAQGGARVTSPLGIGKDVGALTVPVVQQIDNHLAFFGSFQPSDLVLVYAGNNDVLVQFKAFTDAATAILGQGLPADETQRRLFAAQTAAQAEMKKAALELAGYVRGKILANGAKYVAVLNLSDISETPLGQSLPSDELRVALGDLSRVFNLWLSDGLSGQPVRLVDTYAIFKAAYLDPASVGLANVQVPLCDLNGIGARFGVSAGFSLYCNVGGNGALDTVIDVPGASVDTWLFADEIHPSTGGHRALSAAVLAQLRSFGWMQ